MTLPFPVLARISPVLTVLVLAGCGSKQEGETAKADNLQQLATAYQQAANKNGRPPKSVKELSPFLPPGVSGDSLLTSPNDGQPYVIIWGTDPRSGMDVTPTVIGYEKAGKNGTRFVFTAAGVMQMTDADFARAKFPPGHQP